MSRGQRLLHGVLQTREFAHRVVTAQENEQKGEKLSGVHPSGKNFALAKEKQEHYKDHANHFDRLLSKARDFGSAQIRSYYPLGNECEASRFSFLSMIFLYYDLVWIGLL